MACTGYPANGAVLKISQHSSGSPTTLLTIGGFKSWNRGGGSSAITPVSCLAETAVSKLKGHRTPGTFSFTYLADDTDVGQIEAKVSEGDTNLRNLELTLANGKKRLMQGFVMSIAESGEEDGVVLLTAECELTADPVNA